MTWSEELHPRDDSGRFSESGGSGYEGAAADAGASSPGAGSRIIAKLPEMQRRIDNPERSLARYQMLAGYSPQALGDIADGVDQLDAVGARLDNFRIQSGGIFGGTVSMPNGDGTYTIFLEPSRSERVHEETLRGSHVGEGTAAATVRHEYGHIAYDQLPTPAKRELDSFKTEHVSQRATAQGEWAPEVFAALTAPGYQGGTYSWDQRAWELYRSAGVVSKGPPWR